jgi:hypothetical protein
MSTKSLRPKSGANARSHRPLLGGGDISYRSTQAMLGLWLILPLAAALVMAATWNAPPTGGPAVGPRPDPRAPGSCSDGW